MGEEELTLAVEPFDVEVLIPDHARRHLQSKLGELVTLHTIFYIEGNQMGGRMTPRLVGFLSPIDREFFETFCSVDGVGVKKASRDGEARAGDRAYDPGPGRGEPRAPAGIGEATAERIVAKLRRKVGKFSLIVAAAGATDHEPSTNGGPENAEPDVIRDTFAALLSVGHNESQARQAINRALVGKKKFRSVADLIDAIYKTREDDK